jgi:hypothetical protein
MFRIYDFLVWIRIRGFMPLTNGSGSGFVIFVIDLQDRNKKLIEKKKVFLLITFRTYNLHNFSEIKSPKEATKWKESRFFLLFLPDERRMIEGSGSGMLKNMWIRWIRIRIRNTDRMIYVALDKVKFHRLNLHATCYKVSKM